MMNPLNPLNPFRKKKEPELRLEKRLTPLGIGSKYRLKDVPDVGDTDKPNLNEEREG